MTRPLAIIGGNVVDVDRCDVRRADVIVRDGLIAEIRRPGTTPTGCDIIEASGAFVIPGLINAHIHVESSHLVPSRFGSLVASFGTTTAICDPHEIVNVAGEAGLVFMLSDAKSSPCDLRFMLPSCVPATSLETSGATLTAADTARLFQRHPELLGLAEMMDVPGVLAGNPETIGKIDAAIRLGKRVDGHFPFGSMEELRRYADAGISSDHESVSAEDALEKVACGMSVFIREGGSARNLKAVLPAVTDRNFRSFCFCTDDATVAHLLKAGGDMLPVVREAASSGLDPVHAVAMATANPARHYNLSDRGSVREGLKADFAIVRDLKGFELVGVIKDGRPIRTRHRLPAPPHVPEVMSSVQPRGVGGLRFPAPPKRAQKARVIQVLPTEITTPMAEVPVADLPRLARLAVVSRYRRRGGTSYGLAQGTGLARGAVAQTIAHDSHNIIVIGADDADMRLAVQRLKEIGGGVVVSLAGAIIGEFPMPYGGLMTDLAPRAAARAEHALLRAIRRTGIALPSPITTLAFLSLPVIPELKITDLGLVDVPRGRFVDLYE